MNIYQWLNKEKSRFYTIVVNRHGTNNIVLNYVWGSCNSNLGGKKNIKVNSEKEALTYIHKMMKRRKSRGYELISHSPFISRALH